MNQQKLLQGDVVDPPPSDNVELARVRELNRELMSEIAALRDENQNLKDQLATSNAPAQRLRKVLSPLYRSLQELFNDLGPADDDAPVASGSSGEAMDARTRAVWESWKQKLPGAAADIIDALMIHKDANTPQLKVICKKAGSTISDGIYKLNKAGLINKNGGRFSLKQL